MGTSLGERAVYAIMYPCGQPWRRLVRLAAFVAGAPWLLAWWGVPRYLAMLDHFVIHGQDFELDYRAVLESLTPVKGILHIGANVGQESGLYAALDVPRVLWIECQEECRDALQRAVDKAGRGDRDEVVIAAVSERTGDVAQLHRVDNSISSSLKPLGPGHRTYFPFLRQEQPRDVHTVSLDNLLASRGLDPAAFDFMYLDVQGSELDVLRGARGALGHIRALMTEVSSEAHYDGGVLESELHDFLTREGFVRTKRQMPPLGHGNALYCRAGTGS